MIDRSRLPANVQSSEEYEDRKRIVPGAYVCKILRTQIQYARWDNATELLHIDYDIAEGEYTNYWREDYNRRSKKVVQDWGGTLDIPVYSDALVRLLAAVENSNDGFKFESDEKTLVGKLVGFKFRREEYIDKNSLEHKFVVRPYKYGFATVQEVREGKVKPLSDYTLEARDKAKAKHAPAQQTPAAPTAQAVPTAPQAPAQPAQPSAPQAPAYIPQAYQPPKPPQFDTVISSDEELPF